MKIYHKPTIRIELFVKEESTLLFYTDIILLQCSNSYIHGINISEPRNMQMAKM